MPTNNAWNSENPAQVIKGGTGRATVDAFTVICGGVTNTSTLQNVAGLGVSGQVLMSNGPGALPSWSNAPTNPAVNTAFSASVYFNPTIAGSPNPGYISTVFFDAGSNITGDVYNINSSGIYYFCFSQKMVGNNYINFNNRSSLLIGGGYSMQYDCCPARAATVSAVGEPAGVTEINTVNILQCTAGWTVQPYFTVDIAGVSGTGIFSGFKIY